MSELIKREDVQREIQASFDEGAFRWQDGQDLLGRINALPTASPWHRVEDELPVKGEIVIVSDGKRTWDVGQYHCLVSSDDRTKWWWKGHTIQSVKWWMRTKDALPEPPKEDA